MSDGRHDAGDGAGRDAGGSDRVGTGGDDGDESRVPEWDDEYLDRVGDRLKFNFDLERDRRVAGERFDLYGEMRIRSQKQFFHPALSYARQDSHEHLFAKRVDRLTVADLEAAVETGHDLAEAWIDADEEHHGTEFTFVFVAPGVPAEVREFVEGFRDRTLLRYGYHGHYEVNLVAVAPEAESVVASEAADVWRAFVLWETSEVEDGGLLGRLRRLLSG